MLYGIAAAATALLLTALLGAALRIPALRLRLVGRRRQREVPLSGGVAVVVVTGSVVGVKEWGSAGSGIGGLLVAGGVVALLGLVDDVWRLRRRVLAAGTAVAAACVVPYGETGVGTGLLAVGWAVGVTFAFRGLDHADGLAGTVGVVTAFGVAACAAVDVLDGVAVLMSVLAAALTGFLLHNWHPARVALGSCGSMSAGFVIALGLVHVRAGFGLGESAGVLFALTALVSADAVLVVLARRLGGRPVVRSGPDHLAHRLRRLGLTVPGVTLLLGFGAFSGVLVGVLAHAGWVGGDALWWVAGGALVVGSVLSRVPVYADRRTVSSQVRASLRVRNG
ncbi:MraY family glycosyltransferase [Streptomyces caelestis]|uniref:UDP-GlcNAc:undecaprenyl-phosphate GlcNAc-1-phosphate transferase n=1 Tax=Streptomyces caelestis TaxID=36816 RepID=A0A7W9H646_9ACTN|nr:MraY family glycosyltransferase [Streptomyces caelestis]MBB5796387.1 UDP-GlcNAc:undecaprenyl-phosphate GlcNAc-1-phosphate transferase [Streptomyces caelestis]GGW41623.1 putative glycosyltransferase [Streptomyces caelestis]